MGHQPCFSDLEDTKGFATAGTSLTWFALLTLGNYRNAEKNNEPWELSVQGNQVLGAKSKVLTPVVAVWDLLIIFIKVTKDCQLHC